MSLTKPANERRKEVETERKHILVITDVLVVLFAAEMNLPHHHHYHNHLLLLQPEIIIYT